MNFLLLGWNTQVKSMAQLISGAFPMGKVYIASYSRINIGSTNAKTILLLPQTELEQIDNSIPERKLSAVINFIDKYVALHGLIVDKYRLHGPSRKSIDATKDKASFHKLLLSNNLGTFRPHTKVISTQHFFRELIKSDLPLVVKPHIGAKSRGVFILTSEMDKHKAARYFESYFNSEYARIGGGTDTLLIEEYIQGKQVSITCFVDRHGVLHSLGMVDVITGSDLNQAHTQLIHRTTPSSQPKSIFKTCHNILQQVVTASGIKSTFLHPDFIVRRNIPYLIELNIRLGGLRSHLTKYSLGVDVMSSMLDLALGKQPFIKEKISMSATATEVWPIKSGKVVKVSIPKSKNIKKVFIFINEGSYYQAPPDKNTPVAQFYTSTPKNSLATAQAILDEIQIEIE